MRITVSSEGGGIAAAVPGLQPQPLTVDTQEMAASGQAAEAAALVDRVREAQFFTRSDLPAPPSGAADFDVYGITVEDGGQTRTIETTSLPGHEPSELRELRHAVRRLSTAQKPE